MSNSGGFCCRVYSFRHNKDFLRFYVWDLAALVLILAAFLMYTWHTQLVVEGWDSLAYLYAAERIASGEIPALCNRYNETIGPYFTLAGFNVATKFPGCLLLNYPPGFPLLLAAFKHALPLNNVVFFVPALFGALGVALVYFMGRLLFDARIGLTSAFLLMLAPTYVEFSTALWSDVPVAVLLLAGGVILIWGYQSLSRVRAGIVGFVASIFIGWAILSRYTAVVYVIPLAFFFVSKHSPKQLLRFLSLRVFVIGLFLVMIGILLFNNAAYGGYLITPYSSVHGWYTFPKFSWRYIVESPVGGSSLIAVMRTLWNNYHVLLLMAILGLFCMQGSSGILAVSGLVVHLGLYILYAFPAEGINSRFIVPALPFLSIAIGCGIWHSFVLPRRWLWMWRVVCLTAFLFCLLFPFPAVLHRLDGRNMAVDSYVKWISNLAAQTEPDAVILAYYTNDPIFYHGERLTLFYRRIPGKDPEGIATPAQMFERRLVFAVDALLLEGRPVYYVIDADPPFMDSFTILQEHFNLSLVNSTYSLYKIDY